MTTDGLGGVDAGGVGFPLSIPLFAQPEIPIRQASTATLTAAVCLFMIMLPP